MAKSAARKPSVEEQLDRIRALRTFAAAGSNRQSLEEQLLSLLSDRNNLVVARAADLARDLELASLLDTLIAAFKRFLDAPANKDPQCWAKNALSKALHTLGCDHSALYLRGLRLHQYEPVWGGQADVAGTLRANCAHALVDCHELPHHAVLLHLLEVVADKDKSVRAEAMRAIAQAGGESAMLLLRLRVLTAAADEEPVVLGQCFSGLLALEGTAAVTFVAAFLADQDDRSAEAALALGETRTPEALAPLLACFQGPAASDASAAASANVVLPPRRRPMAGLASLEPAFAGVLLTALALTRQPGAIDLLLAQVESESSHAEDAIHALGSASLGPEIRDRLQAIVTRTANHRLKRVFEQQFPPGAPS